MNTEEMMKMCRSLAYKYNSPNQFDDLVSEGMLECLEQVDQGNTHGANLRRMANRAMHDYMNLKNLPITVPVGDLSRSLARGQEGSKFQTYSEDGEDILKIAVASTTTPIESVYVVDEDSDPAVVYEKRQDILHTIRVARKTLSDQEWGLVEMRYFKGVTLAKIVEDCGGKFGTTPMEVKRAIDKCIKKVTEAI